jgi:hypothetical protein
METHVQLHAPAALPLKKDPLAPIKHKSEHKKTAAHADNQIPIMQSLH